MPQTTKAGALLRCTNAHLTRGGEIEKRKSFVRFASLPASTFGMQALKGNLYVFGSIAAPTMPSGVNYQRLQHPGGIIAMSRILSAENFNGKIYAIVGYADGSIYHYYNGSRVTDWDTVYATVADASGVAASLADLIDQEDPFVATSLGATVTITAATAGVPFTISKSTTNGGGVADQDIVLTQTVANVVNVPEVLAVGSLTVTGGTAGSANKINNVTINGVVVTNAAVSWITSNTATATALAANINSHVSSPDYAATSLGAVVTITAVAGSGSTPNGFIIAASVGGTATVGSISNMAGGVTEIPAVSQVYTAQITGTFEALDTFTINLGVASISYSNSFTVAGQAAGMGRTAKTFKTKLYSETRSLLYFSEINDPTKFSTATNGSGFINVSNEDAGSEELSAMGVYQGKLAVFSRRTVQIWDMDPDPTKNVQTQILNNIGTLAPKSVVSFGDLDVFFLSDSGIRSLKARDASNAATVSDIGTNIDPLIEEDMLTISEATRAAAVGIIEPTSGRYWLAMGTKVYVYSYFPTPGISAWSTYEPGFTITDFSYAGARVYARSGDTIYLYGGISGQVYDSSVVDVILPYMDGGKPAHNKTLEAFDMSCDGTWDVYIGMDQSNQDARDLIATVTDSTWSDGRMQACGIGTHAGIQLKCTTAGYARIGNVAAHFQIDDAG